MCNCTIKFKRTSEILLLFDFELALAFFNKHFNCSGCSPVVKVASHFEAQNSGSSTAPKRGTANPNWPQMLSNIRRQGRRPSAAAASGRRGSLSHQLQNHLPWMAQDRLRVRDCRYQILPSQLSYQGEEIQH